MTAFIIWFLIAAFAGMAVAYFRTNLMTWTAVTAAVLLVATVHSSTGFLSALALWVVFAAIAVPLNHVPTRRQYISRGLLKFFQKAVPKLSETEQTALEAGTVGWEGDLFAGRPEASNLRRIQSPELTGHEKEFLDGPVQEVCRMVDDWKITHEDGDMSPEVWDFLKKNKFFGMIIPKRYGGLEFSAYAHSVVLQKLASVSGTVASTVSVPNSLGPAELLLHYGTEEQKNHYLPRLAVGEEVPCFGLTGPTAGSDATSLPDTGVVCKGEYNGKEVLGLRLNFNKRYITLAPVATVVGLAFRCQDPDGLLGDKVDRGITLALIPRDTAGMDIGRRHLPLNIPFMNGPIIGNDVFIPLDFIIGGQDNIGQGWRMLVECLSVGRAISLPSNATGGMKALAMGTGAYARVRKQFNLPIGKFEGVQEAMARIGGYTYGITALSKMTAGAVDNGEKPSVPSAIAKYWGTELGREVVKDAMDVHGGKGIILGPKNYLGRAWQGAPIGITVEGANILTRSMIIFGQGAVRCHPYVLKELEVLSETDPTLRLQRFDDLIFSHIGFTVSNVARSFWLGATGGAFHGVKASSMTRRHYRRLSRYSASLALVSDIAMSVLGGKLKFKESLSARLGDVLSHLYIVSATLKHFEEAGEPAGERPLLDWACNESFHRCQEALDGFIRNFPNPVIGGFLRLAVFPLGRRERRPSDRANNAVAKLMMTPSDARNRLSEGVYFDASGSDALSHCEATFRELIELEPVERKVRQAVRNGHLEAKTDPAALYKAAAKADLITDEESRRLIKLAADVAEVIAVDDFPSDYLAMVEQNKSAGDRQAA